MATVDEEIRRAANKLADAGVPGALKDARRLMALVLGVSSASLIGVGRDEIDGVHQTAFNEAIAKRAQRIPVSHITGERAFFGRDFIVTPDTLDPRPETETLVEVALREPFAKVLDMGTGSGAILVTLLAERPTARGVGIDTSEAAVLVAGDNAARHGVAERIVLPISDWWEDVGGRYDLIVSNPPYIALQEMDDLAPEVRLWEPRDALTDGADGLTAYSSIAIGAPRHLRPGGRLIVEIGPTQAAAVAKIFTDSGLETIEVVKDLDGRDRVVLGRKPV